MNIALTNSVYFFVATIGGLWLGQFFFGEINLVSDQLIDLSFKSKYLGPLSLQPSLDDHAMALITNEIVDPDLSV